MQHFIRMNFRTLGRRTSLLSGANINRAQRQTHLGGQRERRKLECLHHHAPTLIKGRSARVEEHWDATVRGRWPSLVCSSPAYWLVAQSSALELIFTHLLIGMLL